ncbi:OLC1v1031611C1 [Oldenlandia corymbosa var. corymbosa]|uniref:OLC1v1031611C1 n=1 Tax=Oldenlandia corymbosa var. corymbosa TaxID=529605 RepID=A0AAV1CM27_OLDCO|nr:OLC1v1031611C1 [Oldenlandia corymbosa var. corymbosa]
MMTQTRSKKDLEERRRSGEMSAGRLDVESRISDMESKFSDHSQQMNEMMCSIVAIQGSMLQMNAQFKEFMTSFHGKEGIMGVSPTDKSKAPAAVPVIETVVDSPAMAKVTNNQKEKKLPWYTQPRIKLSVFTRDKARDWIKKCEKFFLLHQLADDQKLDYVEL